MIFQRIGGSLNNETITLFESDDGTLWVSNQSTGLSAYNQQQIIHFSPKDGLANDQIHLVHQARDGTLWFGSAQNGGGLSRFDGKNFTNFLAPTDLCHG